MQKLPPLLIPLLSSVNQDQIHIPLWPNALLANAGKQVPCINDPKPFFRSRWLWHSGDCYFSWVCHSFKWGWVTQLHSVCVSNYWIKKLELVAVLVAHKIYVYFFILVAAITVWTSWWWMDFLISGNRNMYPKWQKKGWLVGWSVSILKTRCTEIFFDNPLHIHYLLIRLCIGSSPVCTAGTQVSHTSSSFWHFLQFPPI